MPPHAPLKAYYADEAQRRTLLNANFDSVAPYYDRINRLAAFGTGGMYLRRALRRAGIGEGMRVLDVACGTGATSAAARRLVGGRGSVVAVDPSIGMIEAGLRRGRFHHVLKGIAEKLPVSEASFDLLTMTFALRHVADLLETFREFRRALVPGGRILILEMTVPDTGFPRHLLRFHVKYLTPLIALLVARSGDARWLYRYCWESHERCVRPEVILDGLVAAGFTDVSRHVEIGIFSAYTATNPESASPPSDTVP